MQIKKFVNYVVGFGILAILICLTGCAQRDAKMATGANYTKAQGDMMQKRGLVSSDDWVEFSRLTAIVHQQGCLSDGDFERLLNLMKAHESTIRYYPSRSVVATHITAMSIFRSMNRASPTQRQQAVSAVSPLLNSQNKYERIVAKQVINKLGHSG